MAQVSMYIPDYVAGGNKCPSCLGPVTILWLTDQIIHIDCPVCTWSQLACVVYGIEPWEIPFAYDETRPARPL